jgi:hypothetical protein
MLISTSSTKIKDGYFVTMKWRSADKRAPTSILLEQFYKFKKHETTSGDHIFVYYSSTVQCTSERSNFRFALLVPQYYGIRGVLHIVGSGVLWMKRQARDCMILGFLWEDERLAYLGLVVLHCFEADAGLRLVILGGFGGRRRLR